MRFLSKTSKSYIATCALALVLLLITAFAPFPYVREEAGRTFDSLGKIEGTELLSVQDTVENPTYPTDGKLVVLTVSSWGGPYGRLTWFDSLRTLVDDSVHIVPASFIFPESTSSQDLADQGQQMFASSESNAIAAAMGFLGIKTTTTLIVADVAKNKPSENILKDGDVITSFNDVKVENFDQIKSSMANVEPGTKINVTVLRDGVEATHLINTIDDGNGRAVIGISVYSEVKAPMDIKVHLKDVGGPSAGLNFALTIIEKLTKADYIRGRTIAVTGEIDELGKVGPIGGMPQKIQGALDSGASIMLIPVDNCSEIPEDYSGKMRIVPVESINGAISALSMHTKSNLPTCDNPQIWHSPADGR